MSPIPSAVTAMAFCLALTGCSALTHDGAAAESSSASRTPQPEARLESGTGLMTAPQPRLTPLASDGRPRRASLTIPAIGVRALPVVPYQGSPDDGPGTRIQNGGVAASPFGPLGGEGPGGVGNYIVTAHRTSSSRAFANLPGLEVGDRVHVVVGDRRYVYRITQTRQTSFRSQRSLARQSAAVPGHPGRDPERAMITLSTCATQEDHARGNYWADEFDNPEHRIDKIGVLVAVSQVP